MLGAYHTSQRKLTLEPSIFKKLSVFTVIFELISNYWRQLWNRGYGKDMTKLVKQTNWADKSTNQTITKICCLSRISNLYFLVMYYLFYFPRTFNPNISWRYTSSQMLGTQGQRLLNTKVSFKSFANTYTNIYSVRTYVCVSGGIAYVLNDEMLVFRKTLRTY